jgi:uncharacterized membrane protein
VRRNAGGFVKIPKSNQAKAQILDDRGLAFAVYILYFVGYFTGITSLIGVVIAHLQAPSTESAMKSHYTFQIRTFWIGFFYLLVGAALLFHIIGGFVLLWAFVWSLIRNIKGILALNRNEPIPNPQSWLFGD